MPVRSCVPLSGLLGALAAIRRERAVDVLEVLLQQRLGRPAQAAARALRSAARIGREPRCELQRGAQPGQQRRQVALELLELRDQVVSDDEIPWPLRGYTPLPRADKDCL
jgi:hypothetical protein